MKHTTDTYALKSHKDTKMCKFVAMAMSLSVAAIVGYAVLKPAPDTVEAHAYTNENKVAVAANEQKVKKVETPEAKQSIEQAASEHQEESQEGQAENTEANQETKSPASSPVETPAPVEAVSAPEPVESAPAPQPEPTPASTPAAQPVVPAAPVSEGFEAFEEVQSTPAPQPAPVEEPQPVVAQSTPVEPETPAQPASLIGSDGIWHITYVPAWGAGSAPADGSIGIWADGWFIAHSGMINGDTIASLPQYVEVDGQVYAMTDTWVSGDSVDTNEIARARANNGIVFQTCITDTTNRLVHYEPVNGAGYAYNFTSFPYTTQDAAIFGM